VTPTAAPPVVWDADGAIDELRHHLWRYLSAHARPEDRQAVVESLLGLDVGELDRLVAVHLLLSDDVERALDQASALVSRLPSAVRTVEETMRGYVHGPVNWSKTGALQQSTKDPTLFVCRPATRRFDSPAARLTKLAMQWVVDLADVAALGARGPLARTAADLAARARRVLANEKLQEAATVTAMPARQLDDLEQRDTTSAIARLVGRIEAVVVDRDAGAQIATLAERVLRPHSNDTLFELQVGFRMLDLLVDAGWEPESMSSVAGSGRAFAVLARGGERLTVWWQRSVWKVPGVGGNRGAYAASLTANELRRGALRPDFVLRRTPGDTWLFVEAKLTEIERVSPERRGLVEMLAYLSDAREFFAGQAAPHGLVVAYGGHAVPAEDETIMVASHALLGPALANAHLL